MSIRTIMVCIVMVVSITYGAASQFVANLPPANEIALPDFAQRKAERYRRVNAEELKKAWMNANSAQSKISNYLLTVEKMVNNSIDKMSSQTILASYEFAKPEIRLTYETGIGKSKYVAQFANPRSIDSSEVESIAWQYYDEAGNHIANGTTEFSKNGFTHAMIIIEDNLTSRPIMITRTSDRIVSYTEMNQQMWISGVTFSTNSSGQITNAAITRHPIKTGPETAAEAIANRKERDKARMRQ